MFVPGGGGSKPPAPPPVFMHVQHGASSYIGNSIKVIAPISILIESKSILIEE